MKFWDRASPSQSQDRHSANRVELQGDGRTDCQNLLHLRCGVEAALEIDRYRTPNALHSDRYNKGHAKRIRALTALAGTRGHNLQIGSATSLPAHDKVRCRVLCRGCVIVALRDHAHVAGKTDAKRKRRKKRRATSA